MAASIKTWVDNSPPQCAAADLNGFEQENNKLITSTAIALDDLNNNQTTIAVSAYAANGDFYTDSGAPNAYVLSPLNNGGTGYKAPPTYSTGMRIRFIPGNSNNSASTVNVASLGVKDIVERDGTALDGGEIEVGRLTECQYNGTAFVLIDNGSDVISVPTGCVLPFAGATSTTPDGFLFCNGAAISRTTFARLFAIIGVLWGVGDGSTTFNIPDGRSRLVMGAGAGSGLTARTIATSGGAETVGFSAGNNGSHGHSYGVAVTAGTGAGNLSVIDQGTTGGTNSSTTNSGSGTPFSIINPYAAYNLIIKT